MNCGDYLAISSEINQLESLLSEIPSENVIERLGLEARLQSARSAISGMTQDHLAYRAKLTFRGRPVCGSHGIFADFAARAAGAFTDAVSAVAAGLSENLRYMGPIPDKQKNQLLITGTAIGSFGFEFEIPKINNDNLVPDASNTEEALRKVQELFGMAAKGSDDEVAEIVDEIHPRAVKKIADFLSFLAQQDSWCGLEYRNNFFRFEGVEQLSKSAERLAETNIREVEEQYFGEFQGVLPTSRTFEYKLLDQKDILRGKIGPEIEDADVLNREFLHKPVNVTLHVIQVGQGRPRFSLQKLDNIAIAVKET